MNFLIPKKLYSVKIQQGILCVQKKPKKIAFRGISLHYFLCKRIPAFQHSAKILAFSENPQTIPLILKNLKIFGIQRNFRTCGGGVELIKLIIKAVHNAQMHYKTQCNLCVFTVT